MGATKAALRQEIRDRLNGLTAEVRAQAARKVAQRLAADAEFCRAKTVALFASLPDELDTHPTWEVCRGLRQRVCLPRLVSETLEFCSVAGPQDLHPGPYGIPEPRSTLTPVGPGQIDVVLVPGVAFTRDGQRLGRGKGFYDRALATPVLASARRYGVSFNEQIVDALPREPHDVDCHRIFTPSGSFGVHIEKGRI